MKIIKIENEKNYIQDFLKLPEYLYDKHENMESPDTVRSLLLGTHPLSSYFKLDKFIVYDDHKPAARFCITSYDNDTTAYLGFFECINDVGIAKFLFDYAVEYCKKERFKKILGPVDASFWIKYRLKINKFEIPYTGEPYNKDYYFELFKTNGFEIVEHYTSHAFRAIDETYLGGIYEERYKKFLEQSYEIKSPDMENFKQAIDDVYNLLTKLYSDFPVFKDLLIEDFRKVFMDYKLIMNMSMTKIAYYEGKAVGFYISVPDYGNTVYHTKNLLNLIKIFNTKSHPKRYVMLYMGVAQEHKGLGKALVYAVMKELMKNKLPSIGALMRDGKLTQTYANDDITDVYEYVLLERDLQ